MNLFKKNTSPAGTTRNEALFQEIVKETNELYDDVAAEYETIENVAAEFSEFADDIMHKLADDEKAKIAEFVQSLNKVHNLARKSMRDIRDLLRQQRKALSEIRQE